eukprot:98255-Chlamydomonas_euryale.AAC.2
MGDDNAAVTAEPKKCASPALVPLSVPPTFDPLFPSRVHLIGQKTGNDNAAAAWMEDQKRKLIAQKALEREAETEAYRRAAAQVWGAGSVEDVWSTISRASGEGGGKGGGREAYRQG